jgi:benzoyl-CoA reductase/2-hydroxyglutaryl-CoA dehydratase subunit BcrC/BadD/HgdB
MKKLLFFILSSSLILVAEEQVVEKSALEISFPEDTAFEHFIAFKKMELGHKLDWFDFMNESQNARTDLLKKHHQESIDFEMDKLSALQNLTSQDELKKFAAEQLKKAVELHRKQKADWRHFAEQNKEKSKSLALRHEDELNAFLKIKKETQPSAEHPEKDEQKVNEAHNGQVHFPSEPLVVIEDAVEETEEPTA